MSRRIYLTISHHDHPDQHDVDVNAQRLVVINFIHLKKGGKSNGGKLRPSQLSSPSCAPCSHVPHPSRLSKTRCKDLIPLLPLWEGGVFLHFPICNKHEVKRPSGKKPTFPQEWLRWSMTSPISIKGCVSSTTLLNEPLPPLEYESLRGMEMLQTQHPKEKRLFDPILCLFPKPGLSSVASVSQT